ncbi:MAG TPA: IDEAL domain-containing protein [Bacillota bacterium]|nr:IDEAL domain-containing protein [Bacillota bacterium]
MSMRPVELAADADEVVRQAVMLLIDHALDCNDKATFLILTRELKKLEARVNSPQSPKSFS